jgi:hypothetical protein
MLILSLFICNISLAEDVFSNFDCVFSARDVSLGEIGESIPFNPGGVYGNPASIAGVNGILYSEKYMPYPESSGYVHSAAVFYSQDKFTEYILVQAGFNTPSRENEYFNFDFPVSQFRKGSAGLAYTPVPNIIIGIGGNVFQDVTPNRNTMGFSGNVGLQLRLRFLTVSANGRNLGFDSGESESVLLATISSNYNTGILLNIFDDILRIGGQLEFSGDYRLNGYSLGSEFTFANTIFLRAGYKAPDIDFHQIKNENYSVGAGLKIGKITGDYAVKINPDSHERYIHYMTFGITDFARN